MIGREEKAKQLAVMEYETKISEHLTRIQQAKKEILLKEIQIMDHNECMRQWDEEVKKFQEALAAVKPS